MKKNKLLLRIIFLVGAIAVLGTAYGLAWQSGILHAGTNKVPAETDPWKLLQRMHRYYQRDSVIEQSCKIRLYDEKAPGTTLEQYDCIYYGGKDEVYTRLGSGETWCSKELTVITDLDNKIIQLMPGQPELISMNMPALKQLQKMVSEAKGQLSLVEEQGKQVLTYHSEFDTDVKKYRIYFDPVTGAMTTMKMEVWKDDAFMQEQPGSLTIEIKFGPLKTLARFPENYGRNRFLQPGRDTLSLQPDYINFELVNQLQIPTK
jgi:hypothetical protein